MLSELKINSFVSNLASESPAPGGGAVAALSGALSAALCSMMANLSLDKKGCEDIQDEAKNMVSKMVSLSTKFAVLIDDDAASFDEVIDAFKMPRTSDEEKQIRIDAIQTGFKNAIEVPFVTAKTALSMFDDIKFIVEKGNPNVITDGVAAAMMARVAVQVALLNVKINLQSVKDSDYVINARNMIEEYEKEAIEREKEIIQISKL